MVMNDRHIHVPW